MSADWIATARRRDKGRPRDIEDVLWVMGSPATDISHEKRRARRVLTLVLMLRAESEAAS